MNDNRKQRTEQKLRYADLHLRELEQMPPGRGHDFERAHLEAVFAQLVGAYDALLLEINNILRCGLEAKDISLGKLLKSLKEKERSSTTLRNLNDLLRDEGSWLHHLVCLRNAAIHRVGIPMGFNADDGKTVFRHPETLEDFPDDATVTLSEWLLKMRSLTNDLRKDANLEATAALYNNKSRKDSN